MTPVPEKRTGTDPLPLPASERPGVAPTDDARSIDFGEVSDEFDEDDVIDEPARPFGHRSPTAGPGTPPDGRPVTARGPSAPLPTPPTPAAPGGSEPARVNARPKLMWAAGAATIAVLVVAFLLIAKPFGTGRAGPSDPGPGAVAASQRADRDKGPSESGPAASGVVPGRVAPEAPAPGDARPGDLDKWATSICSAINSYEKSSDVLSGNIDDALGSAQSTTKMTALAGQSTSLLSKLRSTLAAIGDAEGDAKLTKVQAAVIAATDDAAEKADPDNPTNANRPPAMFGAKLKAALAVPAASLRSEVDALDQQSRNTITATKACAPLDL